MIDIDITEPLHARIRGLKPPGRNVDLCRTILT